MIIVRRAVHHFCILDRILEIIFRSRLTFFLYKCSYYTIPKSSCKFSNNFEEINILFMMELLDIYQWNFSICNYIIELNIKNNPYFTYYRASNFIIQNWLVLDTVRLHDGKWVPSRFGARVWYTKRLFVY